MTIRFVLILKYLLLIVQTIKTHNHNHNSRHIRYPPNLLLLKEVVENLPIESFVLETDSPYLTPEPYRGQKNEPYNVHFVAKKVAELKNLKEEEVISVTTKTAISQFDLHIY